MMDQDSKSTFDIQKDPYNYMRRIVFGRWKPYLLQAMKFEENQAANFSRFTKQLPISEKVLSQNLRELEQNGLVSRTIVDASPPRTEYRLTEHGKSLIPILEAIYAWGWEDMRSKGLPIDELGEMWHGYRARDETLMRDPYK